MGGVSPVYVHVFTSITSDHTAIKISDFDDDCDSEPIPATIGYPGLSLYIDLFVDATMDDSTVTEPGTFAVWLPPIQAEGALPPTEPFAILTFSDPTHGRLALAESGSVSVTRVSPDQLAGSFEALFNPNGFEPLSRLEGSFNVEMICDPWVDFSSIP
jgi:hypothetical protein